MRRPPSPLVGIVLGLALGVAILLALRAGGQNPSCTMTQVDQVNDGTYPFGQYTVFQVRAKGLPKNTSLRFDSADPDGYHPEVPGYNPNGLGQLGTSAFLQSDGDGNAVWTGPYDADIDRSVTPWGYPADKGGYVWIEFDLGGYETFTIYRLVGQTGAKVLTSCNTGLGVPA